MKTIQLRNKLNEVFIVSPNDLGVDFLTEKFKRITSLLKTMPFLILIPLSFAVALLIYLIFGYLVIRAVSILQYGF